MSLDDSPSTRAVIRAVAKSQKVTNALAIAVSHLANGNMDAAVEKLSEVAALSTEAQRDLTEMARDAGVTDLG